MSRIYFGMMALVSAGGLVIVGCGDSTGAGGAGGATSSTGTGTGTGTTTSTTTSTSKSASTGTGTGTTGTGTGTATASSSTGGATCDVPNDQKDTCAHACAAAFDCGALVCSGTDQLCKGFAPQGALNKTAFTSSCTQQCGSSTTVMNAFLGAIDLTDCQATITALSAGAQGQAFAGFCNP